MDITYQHKSGVARVSVPDEYVLEVPGRNGFIVSVPFTFHDYLGPTFYRKDGEIRTRISNAIWEAFHTWWLENIKPNLPPVDPANVIDLGDYL